MTKDDKRSAHLFAIKIFYLINFQIYGENNEKD